MPREVRIKSRTKMPTPAWEQSGKPSWWVRLGVGEHVRFLKLASSHPGNRRLHVRVDIPHGVNRIYVGVGPLGVGRRETLDVSPDEEESE